MDALKSGGYDLLLLDIMMGRGAEGVMVARQINKDPKLREIPVLIITGIREQMAFLFPGQPMHPRLLPTDALLEKPVEPKLLLEKVEALLKEASDKKSKGA
jgi:CheY-like chemotaxis protein